MQMRFASRSQIMAENLVPVCAAADIPPGTVKSFEVGDERVALYNIDGTFYATEGSCTHAFADLGDGFLEGDVIECCLHFGAFHVPSGKAVREPCFTDLKTYRTEVRDGQVYVDLSGPAPSA
jgi:nitrite reductase/ring-hydroxylating ferredoxin subunit